MFRIIIFKQRYSLPILIIALTFIVTVYFRSAGSLSEGSDGPMESSSQLLPENRNNRDFRWAQTRVQVLESPGPSATLNQGKEIEAIWSKLRRVSKSLERLWCATRDVMSSGGFCVSASRVFTGGNQIHDPELCYFVEALVGNASLVDMGAGLGQYGMCFLRRNATQFRLTADQKAQYVDNVKASFGGISEKPQIVYSWHGFDGALDIAEVSGGFIEHADLSEEGLWLGRRWDWVLSVEVGEHIPPSYENFFIDNLIRHACQGVILTWAVEGQPGHHHINNHNNDYIKKKMQERGLISDTKAEKLLREVLTNPTLAKTSMVFRSPKPKSCLNG